MGYVSGVQIDTFNGGTGYDTLIIIETGNTYLDVDMGATSMERAFGSSRADTFDASTQTVGVTAANLTSNDFIFSPPASEVPPEEKAVDSTIASPLKI